jgi:hypothetical protein
MTKCEQVTASRVTERNPGREGFPRRDARNQMAGEHGCTAADLRHDSTMKGFV